MGFDIKIAEKLAQVLNSSGYACTQAANEITLPGWPAKIIVVGDNRDDSTNGVSLMARIMTFHPLLPRGMAQELSVGWASTEQEAIEKMTASWMLVFFPGLKFLFDEKPHDCTVIQEPVALQNAAGKEYRLILGPLQHMNFGEEPATEPKDFHQRLAWNALADLITRKAGPGVNHLRFYVARTQAGIDGDVFLNGVNWPAGSELLRRQAEGFPAIVHPSAGYGLKQHVFIKPVDTAQGVHDRAEHLIGKWVGALNRHPELTSNPMTGRLLLALDTMATLGSEEEYEAALQNHGVPAEQAQRIVTFLPCAAIRLHYPDVKYADTYFWTNDQTEMAEVRHYKETSEFVLAMDILQALHKENLAIDETAWVATISAENNGINDARKQGVDLSTLSFKYMIHMTSEPVEGEPLKGLIKLANAHAPTDKPWWKLW